MKRFIPDHETWSLLVILAVLVVHPADDAPLSTFGWYAAALLGCVVIYYILKLDVEAVSR